MKKLMLPLAACAVLLGAGCATQSMKGTPFYSGEYERREGPVADRVNLWPLVYYRSPAISVLWPLMEFSPEHQAVRPVYSAFDLDTDHPVYNVLWPIGRFDPGRQAYRVFPVYWGDDYFNVFPLYWHEGQPWSGVGHDALFPFWVWRNWEGSDSLHLAWPFYARYRSESRNAWRLWPLYGTRQTADSRKSFYAWPLGHSYTNAAGSGSSLFPLYGYSSTDRRKTFLSLPYSFSRASDPSEASWDLALPLWYRKSSDAQSSWALIPALSWGGSGNGWADRWFAMGLGRWASSGNSIRSHLLPVYAYGSDPEEHYLYTLPWWRKQRSDGSGFSAIMPLYYHGYSKDASSFYSLPWSSQRHADGSGWRTAIPFFYQSQSTNSSAFYSPVWMAETHPDGSSWNASFPLYYKAETVDGSVLVTPLYARKLHADGSSAWRCFIPVVYVNDDYDSHFMTMLGGAWRLGDRRNWLALPLLSGGASDATSGKNLFLGGLAAQRWSESGGSHYVVPFYYRNAQEKTLVSLPYSTWKTDERQNHVIPPLLSGWFEEDDATRGILAAGLAGFRSGDDPYSHLFPLYYSAPTNGSFYSIPYSTWMDGEKRNHLVLPLLSTWHSGGGSSGGAFAFGLTGYRSGGDFSYSYLLPLYYAAPDKGSFVSLPYATWSDGDQQRHMLPWLLSGWNSTPQYTDYLLLAGLGHWRQGIDQVEASHLLPFWMWQKDEYFYSALYGSNREKSYYLTPLVGNYEAGSGKTGSWIAPFYWYQRKDSGTVNGYYFPLGYFHKNDHWRNHGFLGLYDYTKSSRIENRFMEGDATNAVESTHFSYLLGFGGAGETWLYELDADGEKVGVDSHYSSNSFFPLWKHNVSDRQVEGSLLETRSVLGILYDSRHEQESEEQTDYLRRRVLWRLFHYEKLNGDMSTDIFPGITIDSYESGYRKVSVLWRLFRYERDPESDGRKLDLLFVPLKR